MILVLNCGSSSLEFSLCDEEGTARTSGRIEDIGGTEPLLALEHDAEEDQRSVMATDCAEAMLRMYEILEEIYQGDLIVEAIGHRIVHGGERFVEAALITPEVEKGIEACVHLAPLHNPAHLIGIRAARAHFPDLPQVAVFDTAFHQTLPARAYCYALPYELYEQEGIRRYGFHGIAHRYTAQRAAALLERETFTGISCHLGNGTSLAAVRDGRSVDTTMGLTPLAGVSMGTRSGDVDPAVVFHLARRRGLALEEIEHLLNEESGLLGLSGLSGDMRQVEEAALQGDKRAQLALEVFTYGIRKAIGAYLAVLGRIDAVVFSGGIGENSPATRRRILRDMEGLGLEVDPVRNRSHAGVEGEISTFGSSVKILIVPTHEESVIAHETQAVVSRERN
ncbi:MAG: acetate kinase [Candidatus Latescibacterota bacterium]|nr:acetate kinase [Candidatus Latescibacterota bacterium]